MSVSKQIPPPGGSGQPLHSAAAPGILYQSIEEAGGYQFTRREEAEEEEKKADKLLNENNTQHTILQAVSGLQLLRHLGARD